MTSIYQTLILALFATILFTCTLTALPILAATTGAQLQYPDESLTNMDEPFYRPPAHIFAPFGRYGFVKRKSPVGTFYAFGGKRAFERPRNTYFAWGGKRSAGAPMGVEDVRGNEVQLDGQQQVR